MPVRIQHLIDVRLDDSPTSQAATWDFQGAPPKRVSIYVQQVVTGAPTRVDYTVELSPDDGQTLISYDKLLTDAGTDAPAATIALAGTADDVFSVSPEDVLDYIRVLATGVGTAVGAYFDVDCWLVWET